MLTPASEFKIASNWLKKSQSDLKTQNNALYNMIMLGYLNFATL